MQFVSIIQTLLVVLLKIIQGEKKGRCNLHPPFLCAEYAEAYPCMNAPSFALLNRCVTSCQLMTLKKASMYSFRRFWYLR